MKGLVWRPSAFAFAIALQHLGVSRRSSSAQRSNRVHAQKQQDLDMESPSREAYLQSPQSDTVRETRVLGGAAIWSSLGTAAVCGGARRAGTQSESRVAREVRCVRSDPDIVTSCTNDEGSTQKSCFCSDCILTPTQAVNRTRRRHSALALQSGPRPVSTHHTLTQSSTHWPRQIASRPRSSTAAAPAWTPF